MNKFMLNINSTQCLLLWFRKRLHINIKNIVLGITRKIARDRITDAYNVTEEERKERSSGVNSIIHFGII